TEEQVEHHREADDRERVGARAQQAGELILRLLQQNAQRPQNVGGLRGDGECVGAHGRMLRYECMPTARCRTWRLDLTASVAGCTVSGQGEESILERRGG